MIGALPFPIFQVAWRRAKRSTWYSVASKVRSNFTFGAYKRTGFAPQSHDSELSFRAEHHARLISMRPSRLQPRALFSFSPDGPYNHRLKQSPRPVTPLAAVSTGLGTGPDKARAAPGLAAA